MDLREAIEEYVSKGVRGKAEKEKVRKLLLVDLEKHLIEAGVPYEISIESLKLNEGFRGNLENTLLSLLISATTSKEEIRKRIVSFKNYLNKVHKVDIVLDEAFEVKIPDKYERLVDLLKMLQEGKTSDQIQEQYNISKVTLNEDIKKLIFGTSILGQEVQIRDIDSEEGHVTYQSTCHPIFLPLNLTEVYYLLIGLKSLAKDHDSFSGSIYDNLANRVYSQLSDYGKNKVDNRCSQLNIWFPEEDELKRYQKFRDEEDMAKHVENTLSFLWKAGIMCNIELSNGQIFTDCYIDYDFVNKKAYIKDVNKEKIELDQNEIVDIQYKYN